MRAILLAILVGFIFNLGFSFNARAGCRDHQIDDSTPECPPGGSPMLNEGYPVSATFISDRPYNGDLTDAYIESVLKAQSERPPQIFFIATPERAREVRAKIAAKAPPGLKDKWLASLSAIDGEPFPWIQDLMQNRIDPRSGAPALSYIQPMEKIFNRNTALVKSTFKKLADAASRECGTAIGAALTDPSGGREFKDPYQHPTGLSGGNLEGGPAGICIVGSDHLSDQTYATYSKQVCGSGPLLKAPTSWLNVGHADEVGMTVRTGPGPCDEAYLITSPRRALEVLKADPNGRAFPELADVRNSAYIGQIIGYDECFAFHDLKAGQLPVPEAEPGKTNTRFKIPALIERAHAAYQPKTKSGGLNNDDMDACKEMTNAELAAIFQALHAPAINKIQSDLDAYAKDLKNLWKKQRPECDPKIIPVPTLYRDRTWPIDQKERMVTRASPYKLSTVNGQQIDRTVLMPEPQNAAVQKDIESQLSRLQLKSAFLDTRAAAWDGGNLHCLTNSVRYCRPRGGK